MLIKNFIFLFELYQYIFGNIKILITDKIYILLSINCIYSSDSKYSLAFLSTFLQSPNYEFCINFGLNASRRVFRTDKRLAYGLDHATLITLYNCSNTLNGLKFSDMEGE